MQCFRHRFWCLLNFPNVSWLSFYDHDMYLQIKEIKNPCIFFSFICKYTSWSWTDKQNRHKLTNIDTSSRYKVDKKIIIFAFSMLQLKRSCDKWMFLFYNQISFFTVSGFLSDCLPSLTLLRFCICSVNLKIVEELF